MRYKLRKHSYMIYIMYAACIHIVYTTALSGLITLPSILRLLRYF